MLSVLIKCYRNIGLVMFFIVSGDYYKLCRGLRNKTDGENDAVACQGIHIYFIVIDLTRDTSSFVPRISDGEVEFINIRINDP